MNEDEKYQLSKQKKLWECVNNLNLVLKSLDVFEEDKGDILPVIDGFDSTHSDTFLELTEDIRKEVDYIRFFSRSAAQTLAEYRQMCDEKVSRSFIKEKKDQIKYKLEHSTNSEEPREEELAIVENPKKSNQDIYFKGLWLLTCAVFIVITAGFGWVELIKLGENYFDELIETKVEKILKEREENNEI